MMSSNFLPFSDNLTFEKEKKSQGTKPGEGAEQQSCHFWPEIPVQTKRRERAHSRGGETNLQSATFLESFSPHMFPQTPSSRSQ